ncbi:MAG: beta-lactamase family protein [Verrucomicrobiales bacterium]|nr:beta-lactamase family protein [Verrucomicrobiales bacterium]
MEPAPRPRVNRSHGATVPERGGCALHPRALPPNLGGVNPVRLLLPLAVLVAFPLPLPLPLAVIAAAATLPGIDPAMQSMVDRQEIAGAVTLVIARDGIRHEGIVGHADLATKRPLTLDTLFWIASMSKPITATAVLLLQDEGRVNVSDPVAKYLPEFAALKTPSGKPANLTLAHLLTHTSGLGEASGPAAGEAKTLADLVPLWVAAPMQFETGERWSYCQSSINAAARVVEVVSGQSFDRFLDERVFRPLGMRDTTFYPDEAQRARLATGYSRQADTGTLQPFPHRSDLARRDRPPLGNGGLFSTPRDYARFCQMLLHGGTLDGRRFLSPVALRLLSTPQTGDLPTGFFQSDAFGHHGAQYGWGLGTCVLKAPHPGVASMLSPGTFGHGGAWGTQAWIDPVKGVTYLLMVQRANFPNSDASDVRRAFQEAAAAALAAR